MANDLPLETWANLRSPRTAFAWGASFVLHAAVTGFVALALHAHHATGEADPNAEASTIAIDLPSMSGEADGTQSSDPTPDVRDPVGQLPKTFGGAILPRADTGHAGRGGQMEVAAQALNLADRDEHLHYSPDPLDRLDRDQIQRLKTAKARAAWEDRRATTHPMELSFLAEGQGNRPERRAPSPTDPSRGLQAPSAEASRPGGTLGSAADPSDELLGRKAGVTDRGFLASAAGLGVTNGHLGDDHRSPADVMHARPDVTLGSPSIPARNVARPSDTLDSDQEVATAVQSLVHASTAGGLAGSGVGGTNNGGTPGAGGTTNEGSHAQPLGTGTGEWFDLDTSDPRLLPYFRKLHAKIDPLVAHAFPKSALLDLRQGTVILDFTIHPDGTATVSWPPLRPSGIPDFDKNCAEAVRQAAPFDPPPRSLTGSSRELRIRAPFSQTQRW